MFMYVCVCLSRIKVYKASGAVSLGEVSVDSKTQLIISSPLWKKTAYSAAN